VVAEAEAKAANQAVEVPHAVRELAGQELLDKDLLVTQVGLTETYTEQFIRVLEAAAVAQLVLTDLD
jgi:hypothetical protein